MSTAFILIPGGRLPVPMYVKLSAASLEGLKRLQSDANRAFAQTMDTGLFAKAPHWLWLWRVLTRRTDFPQSAPWAWTALGARPLAPQVWKLVLFQGTTPTPAQEADIPALLRVLEPILLNANIRLQIWDNALFATCATPLKAQGLPSIALAAFDETSRLGAAGDDAETLQTLNKALTEALAQSDLPYTGALLTDGGTFGPIKPPSLVRAVAADDGVVRGWATSAGIPAQVVTDTQKNAWHEAAPEGDTIAVIDDLYDAWLNRNVDAWEAALPGVIDKAEAFRAAAKARGTENVLVIVSGDTDVVTLAHKVRPFLARVFKKPYPPLDPDIWCAQDVPSTPTHE